MLRIAHKEGEKKRKAQRFISKEEMKVQQWINNFIPHHNNSFKIKKASADNTRSSDIKK